MAAKKSAAKKPVAAAPGLAYSTSGSKVNDAVMAVAPINNIHLIKGHNPRTTPGDLAELTASIKKNGVIQAPTVRVMKGKLGHFEIVAGERRWRAAKAAGKKTLVLSVREDAQDPVRALELAAAENSDEASRPLNAVERSRVFVKLSKKGRSVAAIAAVTGHHDRTVRRCLLLAQAPQDAQVAVEKGGMGMMAALELAKAEPAIRAAALKELPNAPTVEAIRKAVKTASLAQGGADDQSGSTRKKGVNRGASLVTWRSHTESSGALAEAASMLANADAGEKDTAMYHNVRGGVSTLLFLRGDLDAQFVPCDTTEEEDPKAAKALLKKFQELVALEAKKFVPEGEGEDGE